MYVVNVMCSDLQCRKDNSSPSIVLDWAECIQCTRCVRACKDLQVLSCVHVCV